MSFTGLLGIYGPTLKNVAVYEMERRVFPEMRRPTRLLALAVLVVFALSVIAGCGGGGQENPQAKEGTTFIFAQGADPRGLDPAFVDDGESAKPIVNIYENLVQYKPGSTEVQPGLATEWSSSEDGKVWTFKLREGVKFHDGTPFNAEAVKFTVDRQLPPNRTDDMPYASFVFSPVEKVEVVDEYTVQFILNEPYAPFLANIAMCMAAPIVSPTAVEKWGDSYNEHPVGTGPFKFVKWDKGQQIVLERNEDYWGEKAKVDKLVFKFTTENAVRASELITGAVDAIDGVDPNDVKKLEEAGMKVIKDPGMNINYFAFFTDREPFNNVKLRQAVSMAINRDNLTNYLYQGLATTANGPLPSFIPGYDPNLKPLAYDTEKAKAVLADCGYTEANPLKITIMTYTNPRPYNAVGEKLAAAIQADLLKVGIQSEIKTYPWKEYKDALFKAEDGDCFVYGWIGDNGDPDNFLTLLDSNEIDASLNSAKYANAEVDKLLKDGRKEMDPAKRAQIYSELQKIVNNDAPWVYLTHATMLAAYGPDVEGFAVHPTGVIFFQDATKGEK